MLRATGNRCFNILAHRAGRLLGERPGYEIDLEQVFAAASCGIGG